MYILKKRSAYVQAGGFFRKGSVALPANTAVIGVDVHPDGEYLYAGFSATTTPDCSEYLSKVNVKPFVNCRYLTVICRMYST